jgi:hypothetical protein
MVARPYWILAIVISSDDSSPSVFAVEFCTSIMFICVVARRASDRHRHLGVNRARWSGSMCHWQAPARQYGATRPANPDAGEQGFLSSAHPLAGVHPGNFALKMVSGPERGR